MFVLISKIGLAIQAIRLLFKLKDVKGFSGIITNTKEIQTREQQELVDLFSAFNHKKKKRKEKDGSLKPEHCPTTLRMAINYNILFIAVFGIVLCGIFGIVIYKMYTSQQMVYMAMVQDKLAASAEIKLLVEELKAIESGCIQANTEVGMKVHSWDRLTDKEFFDVAILINKNIQDESTFFDKTEFESVINAENDWNKNRPSEAGAEGLTQVMPDTFVWLNEKDGDFEKRDIRNVYYNTRAGIRYWLFCYGYLYTKLGRKPKLEEVAAAYNGGHTRAGIAFRTKDPEKHLSAETIKYMKKVRFYYENIKKKNYKVVYKD